MAANERSGNQSSIIHGKYEYARLLARRGDPDGRPRLHELLSDCPTGAADMGMTRVVGQAQALAETAGVSLHRFHE